MQYTPLNRTIQASLKTKRLIPILVVLLLNAACNSTTDKTVKENSNQELTIDIDSNKLNHADTAIAIKQIKDTIDNQSQEQRYEKNKEEEIPISLARYSQFPGDDAWNGKPMIQQLEMNPMIIKYYPDTLSRLAVDRYKSYDQFFPISIADNFEDGISTEHIEYPKKLTFQFQVFEDEHQEEPYLIKEIVIRRNENGEPYAE